MRRLYVGCSVLFCIVGILGPIAATGQSQIFAYPIGGQSEEQVSRDKFECHQWAVGQTGFNPATAPPLPARATISPPNQAEQSYSDQRRRRNRGFLGIGDGGMFRGGGIVGDAATGAALGAAGGAIAGDAGKGAAIGAISSTLFGALSRSSRPQEPPPQRQRQYQAQQTQADQAHLERLDRVDEYNRAYGACMRSREYTIN